MTSVELVERLLHKADAVDIYPTPMSRLFEVARITEVGSLPDPQSGFIKSLTQQGLNVFLSAMQKIRGIADMRERVIYVPRSDHDPRILFAQGHIELGHQTMVWHNVNRAYEDTDLTLSPNVKAIFEQEANFFSAETIFKGKRFGRRARDYTVEFNSVFKLAVDHGASIQATTWGYIEEQDVSAAALYYYPNRFQIDDLGNSPFGLWKVVPSPKFKKLCDDGISVPAELKNGHPWLAALEGQMISGTDEIDCGVNGSIKFIWQSLWNTHALIVLLRRRPLLRLA